MERTIGWGRSGFGCGGCDRPDVLAGWEARVDGTLVGRLCSPCAEAWVLGRLTLAPPTKRTPARRAARDHAERLS